ncbi:MAG: hypothetical protein Tsb002_01240 [Wenzhouxiangellaceae bacterium]
MSTSTDIDVSYGVSNDFYRLFLDKRMTYTCGLYENPDDDLDQAQTNKLEYHYNAARVTKDSRVLDIGCGWGSNLEFLAVDKQVKDVVGITLSKDQYAEILNKNLPNTTVELVDYRDYQPDKKFDAIISIGMFEHIATPEDGRNGRQIEQYNDYFAKAWEWTNPGSYFSLQSVIGMKIPRGKALKELAWITYSIFPGAISPRLEWITDSLLPYWELVSVVTRREHYAKTTADWLSNLKANKDTVVERWGEQYYNDYCRYLAGCVYFFENKNQSLAQLVLKRID